MRGVAVVQTRSGLPVSRQHPAETAPDEATAPIPSLEGPALLKKRSRSPREALVRGAASPAVVRR
jgi:hypothetical protein